MRKKESSLIKEVLVYLNSLPCCYAKKVHAMVGMRGDADITGAIYGLRFEIECKVYDNKPTAIQKRRLGHWRDVGVLAFAAWTLDDVQRVFEPMLASGLLERFYIGLEVDELCRPIGFYVEPSKPGNHIQERAMA